MKTSIDAPDFPGFEPMGIYDYAYNCRDHYLSPAGHLLQYQRHRHDDFKVLFYRKLVPKEPEYRVFRRAMVKELGICGELHYPDNDKIDNVVEVTDDVVVTPKTDCEDCGGMGFHDQALGGHPKSGRIDCDVCDGVGVVRKIAGQVFPVPKEGREDG